MQLSAVVADNLFFGFKFGEDAGFEFAKYATDHAGRTGIAIEEGTANLQAIASSSSSFDDLPCLIRQAVFFFVDDFRPTLSSNRRVQC